MMRIVALWIIIFAAATAHGQVATDSIQYDSVFVADEDESETELIDGVRDSTQVTARSFSTTTLEKLRDDDELQYKQPPSVAESLWMRFLRYLSDFFGGLIDDAVYTNWGQLFSYLGGLVLLVLIIMLVLRVDAFKLFYTRENAPMQYNLFDENIHEMDFESEIQLAVNQQDYRRGVRLLFLYALKALSDRNHIALEQFKTNHDYVAEVREETLRRWLHELSFYFDYAWYGNFAVSREMFDKINRIFVNGKSKVQ